VHTRKIKVDDKGKKTVAGGREMHWLRDGDGVFYSAFFVPDGWDEIEKGDIVEITYERREREGKVYRNLQEGGIQPVREPPKEEGPEKDEEAELRKERLEEPRVSKEEMHAKWAMECASRLLGPDATQKDIFEKSTRFLQWFKETVEEKE